MSKVATIAEYKPPYPWFGGKSRAADLIWSRLGDVQNYVEPFFGSGAVMMLRPHAPRIETVNDKDMYVANFWRAVQADPEAVVVAADWPVNEADLEARHYWLVSEGRERLAELMARPDGYDAKIAGYWCWGQCAWIGSGWCSGDGPWIVGENGWEMRNAGQGVNRQLPHVGNAGKGHPHRAALIAYMTQLAERLRYVRVCCGDWTRVLTPSVTFRHGMTGIVLDPPYLYDADRTDKLYATDDGTIAADVRRWAIANGDNLDLRIALCGYEGEHVMPDSWSVAEWKAAGGYSSAASGDTQGKANRHRERVWFSPACVGVEADGLFGGAR